jgi:hypothetical protein
MDRHDDKIVFGFALKKLWKETMKRQEDFHKAGLLYDRGRIEFRPHSGHTHQDGRLVNMYVMQRIVFRAYDQKVSKLGEMNTSELEEIRNQQCDIRLCWLHSHLENRLEWARQTDGRHQWTRGYWIS